MTRSTPGHRETSFIESSGGLLTEQLIYKLRDESCSEDAVKPSTFVCPGKKIPTTEAELEARIREVWEDLQERWDEVTRGYELYKMDISEAREKWILKLFKHLGFEPAYQQKNLKAGGIEANLSHLGWIPHNSITADNDGPEATPPVLHTIRPDEDHSLDDGHHLGAEGRKHSPHDEVQRYLNSDQEVQWSIVTDGLKLRLLRDYYHTYTRGYVEFDLENIFTERNYEDFRALYRLCHASRFSHLDPENKESESPIEQLYQVALSVGVKVGQGLQQNVVSAIETLGNGFLNSEIKADLEEGDQDAANDYYQDLLYVIYRILFLMYTEQRGMMSHRDTIYTEEYSITKLRMRAEQQEKGDRNSDLWEGLKVTFRLVGDGDRQLGVPGYNGNLFDNDNIKYILEAECPNDKLLRAIDALTHIEQDGYRQRISYADLGVEEIGAVYESLLEFTPQLAESVIQLEDRTISPNSFYLDDRGMERKETGSYYTDPGLIDELIESSLRPVVDDHVNKDASAEVQEQQLLNISVCDPACGSGAFLIAANNFLGQKLAEIRSDSLYPDEQTIRQARRSVVQHCLYGVDLNPMAVELAKVSLWINSAVEDKPLSFLDHRIKQGNSLIGTTPTLMSQGVPVDAYETSGGRDWHKGNEIRKRVRKENKELDDQQRQVRLDRQWGELEEDYIDFAEQLDQIDESDVSDVQEKEQIYQKLRGSESLQREKTAHDVWTSAFYWPLDGSDDEYPTINTIESIRRDPPEVSDAPLEELSGYKKLRERASRIADKQSFFHWPIEFPMVFNDGGFDCIIGNPPWEVLDLEEKEFFRTRKPEISTAQNKSVRNDLVKELKNSDPKLYEEYQNEQKAYENTKRFVKESGRYKLTNKGHINTYGPFAELGINNINASGRCGMVLPLGIATDSNNQDYIQNLIDERRLINLFGFENKNRIFSDVHGQFKFCLLTAGGRETSIEKADFAFYLTKIEQIHQDRIFQLSPEDIKKMNPNTRTSPTFKNSDCANLVRDIYNEITALKIENKEDGNPWGIELMRMYDMWNEQSLFKMRWELENEGWDLVDNVFVKDNEEYIPLYEAKFMHHFDHRFASFENVDKEDIKNNNAKKIDPKDKNNFDKSIIPRYWIQKSEYDSRSGDDWHLVIRKITNATNRRTVISTVVPGTAIAYSLNLAKGINPNQSLQIMTCLNSFVVDYVARNKLSGTNLSQFFVRQLPIPDPSTLDSIYIDDVSASEYLQKQAKRLTYTAHDLDPFVEEMDGQTEPYVFTDNREDIRYEVEAVIAHIYNLSLEDIDTLFDEFDQLEKDDINEHGHYYTRDKISSLYRELAERITRENE